MGRASDAGRAHVDLSGIGLEISNELGQRLGWERWRHDDDEGGFGDARDRRDIAYEIEVEIPVERDVHRVGRDWHQDRVAIGFGLRDVFGGDVAAGARLVLDHELLTEAFRQMLPGKSRNDVRRAAGWERDDQTYWSRRIGLRPSDARKNLQRSSARGQMQKPSSVEWFHVHPPKKCVKSAHAIGTSLLREAAE